MPIVSASSRNLGVEPNDGEAVQYVPTERVVVAGSYFEEAGKLFNPAVQEATLVCGSLSTQSITVDVYDATNYVPGTASWQYLNATQMYTTPNTPSTLASSFAYGLQINTPNQSTNDSIVICEKFPFTGSGNVYIGNSGATYIQPAVGGAVVLGGMSPSFSGGADGVVAIGYQSDASSYFSNSVALGAGTFTAGSGGTKAIAIGANSCYNGSGDWTVAIGSYSGESTPGAPASANTVIVGSTATANQTFSSGATAVGYSTFGLSTTTPPPAPAAVIGSQNTATNTGIVVGVTNIYSAGICLGNSSATTTSTLQGCTFGSLAANTGTAPGNMQFGSISIPLFIPAQTNPSQQPLHFVASLACAINGVAAWIPLSTTLAP